MERKMNENLYPMIFKRRSFHIFKGNKSLSQREVQEVKQHIETLVPLVDDIKVAWKIVPVSETGCKIGEYAIAVYSEQKEYFRYNAGYMLEQMDLWLASKNIGACFYGMAKANELQYEGLDFVMMLVIAKAEEKDFRKDYTKAKRKNVQEMWQGAEMPEVADVVRFAPSACNSQPWLIKANSAQIDLYRVKQKMGIMNDSHANEMNKIDIGIFMCILELALQHEGKNCNRTLISEADPAKGEEVLVASIN